MWERSGLPARTFRQSSTDDVVYIWPGLDRCKFTHAEWQAELQEREPLSLYLADWFRRNGVDSDNVATDADVYIDNGRVFYTEHKRNTAGAKYIDSATDDIAQRQASRIITVPFGK